MVAVPLSLDGLRKIIQPIAMGGVNVLPIVEGGKGVGVTNGITAGHFAKAGAVGTFSGVNAQVLDDNGVYHPLVYKTHTRKSKHEELIEYSILGAISQAKRAFDISGGFGRIHVNVLWEMGGAQRVLEGLLEKTKGLIHGVTCGAGMPYRLGEIASKYKVHYYPIISSMRAFRALWKRSYSKFSDFLGGVVYECPWRAGGHNGLSNAEDPNTPGNTFERVREIRTFMNEVGLQETPIIVAGGIWHLKDEEAFLNNEEVGKVAFQFGTRPIYTQEYPVSTEWKKRLFTLKEGDIYLNKFSPTGFYSSAVNNGFIQDLRGRSERQVKFSEEKTEEFCEEYLFGPRKRSTFVPNGSLEKIAEFEKSGHTVAMKTPDETMVFVTPESSAEILKDQQDCMGCLSACAFSNWATEEYSVNEHFTTGRRADPRSFCIQKTLQGAISTPDIENNLMFCGSQGFSFAEDPWYQGGKFMPTIAQLVERIQYGY
ncbi:MAG: nitronate monooxygenase [Proteobacteria bacterium]|jgi:nitronate monooxygenase|nr:nitronate monooxygenase [Pseudomonadota bacterium]